MKLRNIPFGYQMELGEYAIHPQEADCVCRIYSLYLSGKGYKAIAKLLDDGNVPYRTGQVWNHNMVKRILENRRYLGERHYPPIVEKEDFQAVQGRIAERPQHIQHRQPKAQVAPSYRLLPYEPTRKILRITNEINRALERSPDPRAAKPLIFACAAEKYNAIGVINHE